MIKQEIIVTNPKGLHVRPSTLLAKIASQFKSEILLTYSGLCVNAKNVMGILSLGATYHTKLEIQVSGTDEEDAFLAINESFNKRFDKD